MPRQLPPLSYAEVIAILTCWGFTKDRSSGSHQQWTKEHQGRPYTVTVDSAKSPFRDDLIASMIRQSGLSRQQFYAGSKSAAKKINVQPLQHAR